MYFALLCCPLLMTNVLHLPSRPIVSRSECHNVVKFFQPEICTCFSGFYSRVPPLCHFAIPSHQNNTFPVTKVTHPPNPLVFCWSFVVVGYFVWWSCQHTLYHLSTHVIVSFGCFSSMLVGFFYVYSSMTL